MVNIIIGSRLLTQTESNATGTTGDLTITTPMLSVQDGAQVSVTNFGMGKGGVLNITASELRIQDGARVLSDTAGTGKGGNLNITASNLVQLSGTGSSLLTQA